MSGHLTAQELVSGKKQYYDMQSVHEVSVPLQLEQGEEQVNAEVSQKSEEATKLYVSEIELQLPRETLISDAAVEE